MGINDVRYLDTPEQWDELVDRCRRAGVFGLDTEFYGLDVRKQSCVGRAKIHVWSVAIRTKRLSPRGYHRARGWVLPAAALEYPPIKALLEDAKVRKAIHNQPVDDHSMANHGIQLRGAINTLDLARWAWPELVSSIGFGLKALMLAKLGYEPVCEFRDVVRYRTIERREKTKNVELTICACGVPGCRLRKARVDDSGQAVSHEKAKQLVVETVVVEKEVDAEYPLESIVPGHERWELLEEYAAVDAIAAVELLELAQAEGDPAPWAYAMDDDPSADERPGYNQRVVDEIVLMERRGFPVDTVYAGDKYAQAEKDEQKELLVLRKWFRKNITAEDGDWFLYDDEDVDAIWSSPQQLVELFDYFGFPRSPVWKKGKVKRGEAKVDGAALDWIAKNHPASKQLIDHVLQLKKVRSQKKYLLKLRDCGGWVNPICGPAGDGDNRNGAVTGRLGIKGVLEAQQLPTREEVDLYQVRKAIVAPEGMTVLVADYSALEVVILADLCKRLFGDTQLEAMVAPGAPDIHVENAKMVFGGWLGWTVPDSCLSDGKLTVCKYAGQRVDEIPSNEFKKHPFGAILRGMIKTVWYGLQYGKGAYGFSILAGPDGKPIGEKVAGDMLAGIEKAVPGPFKWQAWCRDFIDENRGIYSLGGRWCPLYDETEDNAPDWLRARGYRRGYNFPMQATGAEIIGDAMVRIANDPEFKRLGFGIVLQVHDELVAIGPIENVARAKEIMMGHMVAATANGTPLLIPLQVSAGHGPNYYEAK